MSAGRAAVKAVLAPAHRAAALASIESFVASTGLDGVDLDFEPGRWPAALWQRYTGFVAELAAALAPAGRGVEVDLDAFTATPWDAERYADVPAAGAHLVVMAYDHEYDVACSPVTPYSWLHDVVAYAQNQVSPDALTVGLPAYGYRAGTCRRIAKVASNVAYVTMERAPGFPASASAADAARDPASGEVRWSAGGVQYDVVDSSALDAKLALVESMGVTDVSVWSLGGEPWFSGNPA